MRDFRLLIVSLGAILVSVCSSNSESSDGGDYDEPVRMASESLVVKSYKETESTTASTTQSLGDRLEEYQIYQGVMGRPGKDFPVYPSIPATSFSCRKVKKSGYYADLETDCQVFHICDGNRKISFLCPNGTIFRQSHLICDWWFRVDCRKSVELYEESAEQLEADQKVYKARSEDREKRRKHGRVSGGNNGGEVTSSEVYALDEPFHVKQKEQSRGQSSTRAPPVRFEGRKAERHSKKVVDSGSTEKFNQNYNRDKQADKNRSGKDRQYSTPVPSTRVTFNDITATTPTYATTAQKVRFQTPNSINFENNKENIQPAESGSLVEDLHNRNGNFAYNSFQNNNNNKNRGNSFAYNIKKIEEQTISINNGRSEQLSGINNKDRSNVDAKAADQSGAVQTNGNSAYSTQSQTEQKFDYNSNFNNNNNNYNFNSQKTAVASNSGLQTDQNAGRNSGSSVSFVAKTEVHSSQSFNGGSDIAQNTRTTAQYNSGNDNGGFGFKTEGQFSQFNSGNVNSGVNIQTQTQQGSVSGESSFNSQTNSFNSQNDNVAFRGEGQAQFNSGNFGVKDKNTNQTPVVSQTTYSFDANSKAAEGVDFTVTDYTTEYTYESKRTNPIERQETVTPTAFSRKTQSARYRSSTPGFVEEEKQHLAETASFASNRGGKTFADFRNQFQTYNKELTASTPNAYKTTAYQTVKPTEIVSTTLAPPQQSFSTVGLQNYNQQSNIQSQNFNQQSGNYNQNGHQQFTTFENQKLSSKNENYNSQSVLYNQNQQTTAFNTNSNQQGFENSYNSNQQFSSTFGQSQNQQTFNQNYNQQSSETYTQNNNQGNQNLNQQADAYNQNYNQQSTVSGFYQTTTSRPVKQHSRKVTLYPSTLPQTTYTTRQWPTTTFPPFPETTTTVPQDRFTVDDVYFTTSSPEKQVEFITERQGPDVSQTTFNFISSTPNPDVDITLQELNINKATPQTENNKTYEDYVREGLEVPPSSGPNALRTFALYFATTKDNGNAADVKTTYLPVTGEPEYGTTLSSFEIRKKEVVKQVDEIVHSSQNLTEHHEVAANDNTLPSSLTHHTQNSYSELFAGLENKTEDKINDPSLVTEFETTAFESFTEQPHRINKELTKNDLDGSQSRGIVEPDPNSDTDYSKVSPDLRELAQVFTKALSAYLDDPEAFRKVLSEIRPTEPTIEDVSSSHPIEYPSATQEDDEVLDFSDVTKVSYKKKSSSTPVFRETTTEYFTEPPTTSGNINEVENFVVPLNFSSWATNVELTAPFFESLDEQQSSYYTPPPPFIGTTNAIAEEINNEFTKSDQYPPESSNEAVDSYLPIRGSADDPSLPRYGGFQNNSQSTTKYIPYGADLTSTTYLPYGADLTSTSSPSAAAITVDENRATTFNPINVTSFFSHFSKNETKDEEIQLGQELNNLVLLQKFTTPRGAPKETTTPEPNLSTAHLSTQNDINIFQDIQLGNGETLETTRSGKSLHFEETEVSSNAFEPNPKEINLELSPPSSTPKGFLITYSIEGSSSSEPATYLPKITTPKVLPTTYSPKERLTTFYVPETPPPTPRVEFDSFPESSSRSNVEFFTTLPPPTTDFFRGSTKSIDRLTQLQETLMFNTNNITTQQRDQARVSVVEMMDTLNMTDSTANTLMKMMEMAAKNETYRRLVLLLVNDKSGRNKTVEEARLSLLKALLTPVINPQQSRTVVPIPETSRLVHTSRRRSKSINSEATRNYVSTTPTTTTTRKNVRRVKVSRGLTRAESNYNKSGLGNLGLIKRTIENSKSKQVRINSLDDAILDSDSRAVELLKSLYSLAARWG